MASSSNPAEVIPPWLQLPQEITAMILQKLGTVEILTTAEKVCSTWRRVCQDAAMWQRIAMRGKDHWMLPHDLEKLCCDAVDRSQGQLIDITIQNFGSDDMLLYISRRSSKLRRLLLASGIWITDQGVSEAIKNFPLLEKLHLFHPNTGIATIKSVGHHCPHLKSFKLNRPCSKLVSALQKVIQVPDDWEALAIAENMPQLRHLQLIGNEVTNTGIQAILEGCPHLESLDLRQCFNVDLGGAIGQLCQQRLKDLRQPNDTIGDYVFAYANFYDDDW